MVSPTTPRQPAHNRSTSLASIATITSIASLPRARTINHILIPLLILFGIVIASAAQTEIAHHLTSTLGYHQAYFTFYLSHITFILAFPVHLLILRISRGVPTRVYLKSIKHVISEQLGARDKRSLSIEWSKKVLLLTMLVSVPAVSWYIAVNLTTGLSVTTIYASSSFYAYFFSMVLLKQPLSRITIGSIALAFAGVIVLSLGSVGGEGEEAGSNPLLGDGIMMFGAVILGLYEVVYKMALPEGHGGVASSKVTDAEEYEALPTHRADDSDEADVDDEPLPSLGTRSASPPRLYASRRGDIPLAARQLDRQTSSTPLIRGDTPVLPSHTTRDTDSYSMPPRPTDSDHDHVHFPKIHDHDLPPLPTALHANFLTSCIGLATLLILWMPIPLIHWAGWETFRWPGSGGGASAWNIWTELELVALGGAIYNAGLMVLIGIWGPTVASVANLLAIGLVAMFEALWLGSVPNLETWIGVGMICIGFGVLLWEGEE